LLAYRSNEEKVIQEILHHHFSAFGESCNDTYSEKSSKYRIIRIKETVKRLIESGDYSKDIQRIKCTNAHCIHEYFLPFIALLKGASKRLKQQKQQ
jgi:hypothetical protein